jgi:hypothetical protein
VHNLGCPKADSAAAKPAAAATARIERDLLIKERNDVEINAKLRKDLDELNINYANIVYYLNKAVDLTKKWKSRRPALPLIAQCAEDEEAPALKKIKTEN